MPKLSFRPPKYTRHKASGQAIVKFGGRVRYLGPHGSEESRARFQEAIAEWGRTQTAAADPAPPTAPADDHDVDDLIDRFLVHAETHYRQAGRPTGTMARLKPTLREFREMFGSTLLRDFRPSYLEAFRQRMIARGCSRTFINDSVGRIKTMFRRGVAWEIVPPDTYAKLQAVEGLRAGRTDARETEPVLPIGDEVVEATLPYCPVVVADMIRVQRLCGCRPGEVRAMNPGEVDRSGDIWLYVPTSHKTAHRGKTRIIPIGPKAQAVLAKYLLRPADAFCFSPADSERQRAADRREARRSPLTPSQAARKPAKHRTRQPAEQYSKDSLNRAIARAVKKANMERGKLKLPLLPSWSANQLRHTAGTATEAAMGLEAARIMLGHSQPAVTMIYADRTAKELQTAMEVARRLG